MSTRRFLTILLLAVLTVSVSTRTEAQFWKKKSKRHSHKGKHSADKTTTEKSDSTQSASSKTDAQETKKSRAERRKEKKERKKREKEARKELKKANKKHKEKATASSTGTAEQAQPVVIKQWSDIAYPPTTKKSHYRVDILAPMYLDELVKNGYPVKTIPEKAVQGLDFYKGVQIAADTLKKSLFDIDIYVHDVSSLQESTEMLVNKNMMDSTDLIIGAVALKDIPALAGYAKKKQVNFISVTAPGDGGVRDNQYFTMLQPSVKSHCEWIAEDLNTRHAKRRVLVLYRTTIPAEDAAGKYLLNGEYKNSLKSLLCNAAPKKEALAPFFDTAGKNVVVMPILDTRYADSLLKILKTSFPLAQFEVYGMPGWPASSSLLKSGANVTVNLSTPFMADSTAAIARYIAQVFKAEYGGKPTDMVYRGYEAMYWYANMLKRYGTIFNKQYSDNETAPFTHFTVKPQWDDKTGNVIYFENRQLYLKAYETSAAKAK